MTWFFLIVGLVLGAPAGFWVSLYARRPRLVVTGGGGGGGASQEYRIATIAVKNLGGFFGVTIQDTMILGLSLHNTHRWGLPVERDAATKCHISLFDEETGMGVGLVWRDPANPGRYVNTVTIESGEQAEAVLFARRKDQPSKYFVFAPDGDPPQPKEPDEGLKYGPDLRRFTVRVNCRNRQRYSTADVEVIGRPNGMYIKHRNKRGGGGGGSF